MELVCVSNGVECNLVRKVPESNVEIIVRPSTITIVDYTKRAKKLK